MLCESDVLPGNMSGVISLGSGRDVVLNAGAKNSISSVLNITINGSTVEDAIKEIVVPKLPNSSGDYEIILGRGKPSLRVAANLRNDLHYKGWFATLKERGASAARHAWSGLSAPVAWASRLATETFNCSDASTTDCVHDWNGKTANRIAIVSNQASLSGSVNFSADYADSAVATVDHEVVVTFVNVAHSGGGTNTTCSVLGRTTNDSTVTFYRSVVTIRTSGELNDVSLLRTVSGTSTTLATDTTDWAANDVIAIQMVGSTIRTIKNGVENLSATDSNITTGLYGGLRYFSDGTGSQCIWDNWRINDVLPGGPRWFK
jgi:hypothetical protein